MKDYNMETILRNKVQKNPVNQVIKKSCSDNNL